MDLLFPNAGVVVPLPLLLLLGLILGTLSGFFGVGGGFLITGGLLVFGVPPVFAVGTGLTLIMGSSIINTLKHRRMGNVDVKLGVLLVCGTIPALFLAQSIIRLLSAAGVVESAIRYIYVVVLAILAIFIIYDFLKTRRPQAQLEGE
ncbi:MAG: sulfite exporter TauE/SafE family protein [Dehalococcoidia bacterium]|nr:sulfite exporter TauE/SafE family protein [Dehalococcoidia bacterium]